MDFILSLIGVVIYKLALGIVWLIGGYIILFVLACIVNGLTRGGLDWSWDSYKKWNTPPKSKRK